MRILRVLVWALLALLVCSAPAGATTRPTLPNSYPSAHFVVWYDASTVSLAYVIAADADFEEAYAHLVAGGGGTPNAGLIAPVTSPTAVYLMIPQGLSGGGAVFRDDSPAGSAFIEIDPSQAPDQFRFRAGHELMHVIEDAYTPSIQVRSMLTESTAGWAAGYTHPDTPSEDSNFSNTNRPLDCSYGYWPPSSTTSCGGGYWQWMFIERLVEDHGTSTIDKLWQAANNYCQSNPTHAGCGSRATGSSADLDQAVLTQVLLGFGSNLRSAFATYAALVWDPTAWTSAGIRTKMHDFYFTDPIPAAQHVDLSPASADSGSQSTNVDHLAARYVMVRAIGSSGPSDQLRVTVTRPPGVTAAPVLLSDTGASGQRTITTMTSTGSNSYTATVPFDPATTADVVIALVNDSLTADGQSFTWRAQLLSGTPTPAPPGDTRDGSPDARLWLGTSPGLDVSHATGNSNTESPCSFSGTALPTNAVRGVWLWFTAPADGTYTFDSTPSDFTTEMALGQTNGACWTASDGGPLVDETLSAVNMTRGQGVYAFVARSPVAIGTGYTARITVSGPGGVPFAPEITSPAGGWTTTSNSFTISGRSAEPGSTVKLYNAQIPIPGVSTTADAYGHWSIPLSGVANGTYAYEASATNSYGTSMISSYVLVKVNAPKTATTTVLVSSPNPSRPGQAVTYTATVNPVPGGGTVTLTDAGATIQGCSAITVSTTTGQAGCTVTYSTTGSHTIRAAYSGDASFAGSQSQTVTEAIEATSPISPALKCTLTSSGKVTIGRTAKRTRTGKVTIAISCNQAARVQLRATLTDQIVIKVRGHRRTRTRSYRLTTASANVRAGATTRITLKLPPAATRDLLHRARESVRISLQATNAKGAGHASAVIRLRR